LRTIKLIPVYCNKNNEKETHYEVSEMLTRYLVQYHGYEKLSQPFKKYRLRAEFDTFAAFGDALAEKDIYYEDSIFPLAKGNQEFHPIANWF